MQKKESETEETSVFCHIFIIGDISIEKARALPPPWLRLCLTLCHSKQKKNF